MPKAYICEISEYWVKWEDTIIFQKKKKKTVYTLRHSH